MQNPTVSFSTHAWKIDYSVLQKIADATQPYIKDFGNGPAAVARYLNALGEFMIADALSGVERPGGIEIDHHNPGNIEHRAAYKLHCDSDSILILGDWFLLAGHKAQDPTFNDRLTDVQRIYYSEKRSANYSRRRFFENHLNQLKQAQKDLTEFINVALLNGIDNPNRGRNFSASYLEERFNEYGLMDNQHKKKLDFARQLSTNPSQVAGFMQALITTLEREAIAEPVPVVSQSVR